MDSQRLFGWGLALAAALTSPLWAQAPPPPGSTASAAAAAPQPVAPAAQTITLDEAIRRAQANEPSFAALSAESRALRLERTNARAALLPTATYHNQALYTQPNGVRDRALNGVIGLDSPLFIANNAVREYASQGLFTETIGFAQLGAIRLADANAARAAAEAEISRRGLVAGVVNLYYTVAAQLVKIGISQRAVNEADRFLKTTEERESAREVAHADVIKAQLQQQGRTRELLDARLLLQRAQLELGVLLFPDPATPYSVVPATLPPALPDRASVETAARLNNPELRSALASLDLSRAETYNARAAYLPELVLGVAYGIDAPQFAFKGRPSQAGSARPNNLGYSLGATLDIPVWDWLSTQRRVKESHIREDATKVALTAAQRRLLASLGQFYAEASVAQQQLGLLDASVVTARESLRLTNLRYLNAESTALEIVDAQNALILAEVAQTDGNVRYQLALAQLQTLTGQLTP